MKQERQRPRFLVPKEVADLLRIGVTGVNMRRRYGMLKGVRDGKRYVYPIEQFDKFERELSLTEAEIRAEREKAASE